MGFGFGYFLTHDGIGPGELARRLEEHGQDALFVAEHMHIPASRDSPWAEGSVPPRRYRRCYDAFVALMAAVAELRARADRPIEVQVLGPPADPKLLERPEGVGARRASHRESSAPWSVTEPNLARREQAVADVTGR